MSEVVVDYQFFGNSCVIGKEKIPLIFNAKTKKKSRLSQRKFIKH